MARYVACPSRISTCHSPSQRTDAFARRRIGRNNRRRWSPDMPSRLGYANRGRRPCMRPLRRMRQRWPVRPRISIPSWKRHRWSCGRCPESLGGASVEARRDLLGGRQSAVGVGTARPAARRHRLPRRVHPGIGMAQRHCRSPVYVEGPGETGADFGTAPLGLGRSRALEFCSLPPGHDARSSTAVRACRHCLDKRARHDRCRPQGSDGSRLMAFRSGQ